MYGKLLNENASLIGANIRHIRKNKNVKLKDIAAYLSISPSMFSQYETGYRTIQFDRLIGVAKYLDVPISELIKGTNIDDIVLKSEGLKLTDIASIIDASFDNLADMLSEVLSSYIGMYLDVDISYTSEGNVNYIVSGNTSSEIISFSLDEVTDLFEHINDSVDSWLSKKQHAKQTILRMKMYADKSRSMQEANARTETE